jgi:uncharacterized protein YyaL (SSP411 family)
MSNRLAGETSPYLLQHKDNPVDWYPWGDEAFARARAEDKPVFLSVGYSACHWCHVMERESFEDPEIAALLNDSFVCIKVDREERPDVDAVYMRAVQGMTGQGGWPMSVFLTPDGEPYFAGTYFPPRRQSGMPSLRDILGAVLEAYRERRDDVRAAGEKIVAYLESQNRPATGARELSADALNSAFRTLAASFDAEHGGFGGAPKFPQPLVNEFLLRYWHRTGEARALAMAEITAVRMARGGIYDHLGGGFHRYATDPAWLIPHFEKMLYDNALLGALNLHLWQATGKDLFRRVTEETLACVEREMLHPDGAFYSSQDADSEGEEGKFFVWEAAEIDRLLGPELSRVARAYYAVTDAGNFGGRNVLSTPLDEAEVASRLDTPVEDLRPAVREARQHLWEARQKRVRPNIDDKAITSWNALMLKTFAEAGSALASPGLVRVAERNAEFILGSLMRDGRLLRTWRAGGGGGLAKIDAYLEDYACLVDALLTLYEATFDYRRLEQAVELAGRLVSLFWDADKEAFFDTSEDGRLVVRPRNVFDNSHPSGSSTAAMALLRLAVFTGEAEFEQYAVRSLSSVYGLMRSAPLAVPRWLAALDFHLSRVKEIVVIGPRQDPATQRLLEVVYGRYLPNKVVAGAETPPAKPSSPLLEGREPVGGQPTAFVCEGYHCTLPSIAPEGLAAQLEARG